MKPIKLSQKDSQLVLQIAEEDNPKLFVRWGQGKWNENEFLWFHERDDKGVPNLIAEIHWFEFMSRYLLKTELKDMRAVILMDTLTE